VTPSPQILALGGHGFHPDRPEEMRKLDDLILELTGKERPRMLFVPTASAEDLSYIVMVYAAFAGRADVAHCRFFPWPPPDVRELVLSQDAIYVGGGNTANMLAIWRLHGFDALLREAWESGILLCGSSAGMICWFEAGVTDSFGPELDGMRDGLGLLPGSACPHYDGEELRRPRYHELVQSGFPAGVAADDGAGLLYRGTDLAEVVSCFDGSRAYRVELADDEVRETPLESRLL
jgi:dipeptidase E